MRWNASAITIPNISKIYRKLSKVGIRKLFLSNSKMKVTNKLTTIELKVHLTEMQRKVNNIQK